MLRISSFPLSVSFSLTLLFLSPPPPLSFSHPLPICLLLVLPLSFLHFTILFLSPSRCFKAHITPFSLTISPFFQPLFPMLSRSRPCVCTAARSFLYIWSPHLLLVLLCYRIRSLKTKKTAVTPELCMWGTQKTIYKWCCPILALFALMCQEDLWVNDSISQYCMWDFRFC